MWCDEAAEPARRSADRCIQDLGAAPQKLDPRLCVFRRPPAPPRRDNGLSSLNPFSAMVRARPSRPASLVSRGWRALIFSGGQLPFSARMPQPASIDGPRPGGERARRSSARCTKWPTKFLVLKTRVEAVHRQSPSAKEATALEGLKARLDAVKTETGAEIAELAGKVDRLQRELTTKLSRNARANGSIAEPLARGPARYCYEAPRVDAFDPSRNPALRERLARWKSPRPQRVRCKVSEESPANALSLRPRPRREAMPISGRPSWPCQRGPHQRSVRTVRSIILLSRNGKHVEQLNAERSTLRSLGVLALFCGSSVLAGSESAATGKVEWIRNIGLPPYPIVARTRSCLSRS